MKKCRIYYTSNNSRYENEGWPGDFTSHFEDMFLTDDGYVLSAELRWRTIKRLAYDDPNRVMDMDDESTYEPKEPAKVIGGQRLYTPYDGTYISRDIANNRLILPFECDGKWGYCHAYTGEVLHAPKWNFCDEFDCYDCARFNIGEEQWGFIDINWSEGIPPVYQYLSRFEYYSSLAKKGGLWGVIDLYGKIVVDLKWDAIWFDCNTYSSGHGYGYIVMKEKDGQKIYTALDER